MREESRVWRWEPGTAGPARFVSAKMSPAKPKSRLKRVAWFQILVLPDYSGWPLGSQAIDETLTAAGAPHA